jgi:hypothetical protein
MKTTLILSAVLLAAGALSGFDRMVIVEESYQED